LEAARLISASMPQCRMILFTMFASDELFNLSQAAGVCAVVSKDVAGVDGLVQAIETITKEAA
jgi:DNA-binding NarL/FixJ family response regulator